MIRFADAFIAFSIVVVAASTAVVLRFQLGLDPRDATYIGFAVAVVLFGLRFVATRARRAGDLDVLSERIDALRGEVDAIARRLAAVEGAASRRARDEVAPLVAEVDMLGTLLRQVTETVADLELRLQAPPAQTPRRDADTGPGSAPGPAPGDEVRPAVRAVEAPPAERAGAAAPRAAPPLPRRFAGLGERGFLDLVRRSVEANRIDVFLQPMVTLPQRKVRAYECFTRLRTEDGETIFPSDYLTAAERAGVLPVLDNQIVLRAVHLLRRLTQRSRDVGIFCNISAASLASPVFFKDVMAFLDDNRNLSELLVFEMPQDAVRGLGPVEFETLAALAEMGFRFSVDQVSDLRGNFSHLQARGFRYVKIAADLLLDPAAPLGSDIHTADLASHFARHGLDLVVDRVETETQVVDLLEYGLKFGQGFVFSPPRPVRNEMVQSPETAEVVAPGGRGGGERRGVLGRAIAARQ